MFISIPEFALPFDAIPAFSIAFILTPSGVLVFEAFQANGSAIYSFEVASGLSVVAEIVSSEVFMSQIEAGAAIGG